MEEQLLVHVKRNNISEPRSMIRFVVCLLAVVALLASSGCQSSPAPSIVEVMPSGASLTTVGENVQFKAIGTFVHGGHPQQTRDLRGRVNWSSSTLAVATVSSSGLVTRRECW
jgi:hypothetical protein